MASQPSACPEIKYSVVIPVYNSSQTIAELMERLRSVLTGLDQPSEIILVDDSSQDDSWELMRNLKEGDDRLRIIRLRRNFGQHNALMCGFHFCRGEWVITIDDDLQVPPEEIPKLISTAAAGYDVVYGVFEKKEHSWVKNLGSWLINWYYRKIFRMDNRITAFRLISREIVSRLVNYDKTFTYIDGLISWNTSSIGEVPVRHQPRSRGGSGYNLTKILQLAFNMLTNFSAFPIRVASGLGIIFSLFGFGLGLYFFIKALVTNIPVTGYASLIVAITMFSGVQLLTIGVIGEYIARVHININNKPQYVIKDRLL